MKWWRILGFLGVFCAAGVVTAPGVAAPISISVGPATGPLISPDFSGLSYESSILLPNGDGNYTFWVGNRTLLGVYHTLGIRCIRLGGNSIDRIGMQITKRDVDQFFAFARAANVNVIFSLQLKNSNAMENVLLADYIYRNYRSNLKCFTVGNEPNYYIKQLATYERDVLQYISAISMRDPGCVFCGPDAGHKDEIWAAQFANAFRGNSHIALIAHHRYQGGPQETGQKGRDYLLDPARQRDYEDCYRTWAAVAVRDGFPYRLTEENSFNGGGAEGASNTFASALWALDYMYWWASHGADGMNFHNTGSVYPVTVASANGYTVRPIGYGVAAFGLADRGRLSQVVMRNPQDLNVTAYAVLSPDRTLYVTIINKEHGTGGRDAQVSLSVPGPTGRVDFMALRSPTDDSATQGITLGGSAIAGNGAWNGRWQSVMRTGGTIRVNVPETSAMVVRIGREG